MAGTNSTDTQRDSARPGEKWEKPALRRLDAHLAETGKKKGKDSSGKNSTLS